MPKKDFTFTSKLLLYLAAADEVLTPIMNPYALRNRILFGSQGSYRSTVYKLHKRGWIKIVDKNAQKFIRLTKAGQLEVLLAKARLPTPEKWDGKWRMVVFDIPEEAKGKRNLLRGLLKKNNFYQLQASVYINPYPLHREAVQYLQQSGLISYIRIIKVEEMDNDKDLRKRFKLK